MLRNEGRSAFRNVVFPEYKLDPRLKVEREVNMPPTAIYMPLGFDEKPGDKKKHYRKFFPDELEYVTDIMSKPSPFD